MVAANPAHACHAHPARACSVGAASTRRIRTLDSTSSSAQALSEGKHWHTLDGMPGALQPTSGLSRGPLLLRLDAPAAGSSDLRSTIPLQRAATHGEVWGTPTRGRKHGNGNGMEKGVLGVCTGLECSRRWRALAALCGPSILDYPGAVNRPARVIWLPHSYWCHETSSFPTRLL
jgi:hypothetical protein